MICSARPSTWCTSWRSSRAGSTGTFWTRKCPCDATCLRSFLSAASVHNGVELQDRDLARETATCGRRICDRAPQAQSGYRVGGRTPNALYSARPRMPVAFARAKRTKSWGHSSAGKKGSRHDQSS